jgi:hypothetical protein
MTAYVILGLVLGLPLLLGLFFRVNTLHLFFSIMAGELLARYFTTDAELAFRVVTRDPAVTGFSGFAVLVLPVVLTAIILKGTLGKGKLLFHVVPLLLTGLVFAAFALPLMPDYVRQLVASVEAGNMLLEGGNAIIGAVIFLQLITLWLMNRVSGKHGKKHK